VSNIDPLGLSCVHTDDGVTVDNLDGKGCSEMDNTPDQVNVSDKGPGSTDTSSLNHLGSLGYPGGANGGGGGGGAGGGGMATRIWARINCAVNFGDEHSIAAGIYAGKGKPDFVTNLFLGNAASGIMNLFLFVSGKKMPTGADAATVVLSGGGQGVPVGGPGMKGAAGIAQDAAVGAVYSTIRGAEAAPITGITGAALQAGGETAATGAESFAAGVGALKFGYDTFSFGYGLYKGCGD
jgi:hypothetical protein